jgi:hypothetical protein
LDTDTNSKFVNSPVVSISIPRQRTYRNLFNKIYIFHSQDIVLYIGVRSQAFDQVYSDPSFYLSFSNIPQKSHTFLAIMASNFCDSNLENKLEVGILKIQRKEEERRRYVVSKQVKCGSCLQVINFCTH